MVVSLSEAKEWLAIDHGLHDSMIDRIIKAAEIYIKNGTGHEFDNTNELAQQLCLVLIADMYETRTFAGPSANIRMIVESMIRQLSYAYILVPKGLNGTVENGVITLEWIKSTEPNLVGYKIYKDGTEIDKTTTNNYKTDYVAGTYQVSVYNQSGDESKLSKGVIL